MMRRVTSRRRGARKAPLTSRPGNSLNQADRLLAVFLFGRPLPCAAAPRRSDDGPEQTDAGAIREKEAKSGRARTVTLPSLAVEELRRWRLVQPRSC
jgi:hypothetical protein